MEFKIGLVEIFFFFKLSDCFSTAMTIRSNINRIETKRKRKKCKISIYFAIDVSLLLPVKSFFMNANPMLISSSIHHKELFQKYSDENEIEKLKHVLQKDKIQNLSL